MSEPERRLTIDEEVYIREGKIAIEICVLVNESPALKRMLGLTPGDNIMPRLKAWLEAHSDC